jgi:hypothetical protein
MGAPDELLDAELEAMLHRAASARPGPWVSFVEGRDHTSGSSFIRTGPPDRRGEDLELSGATPAEQDFIAAARQDVPRLIAEIRRLRALLRSSGNEGVED